MLHLARDVGRIEAKAGPRAAFDGLQVAASPREMSRIARLAEKEGTKTRAIIKVAGRGAIMLSLAALELGWWIICALVTVFALLTSLKNATERLTLRITHRGNVSCRRKQLTRLAG
jgi:hypothetical protein